MSGGRAHLLGAANAGVHLVIGAKPASETCAHRIDRGEVRRRDDDGQVVLATGGVSEQPPFYAFFVRGDDHLEHIPHEILYTALTGRPVIEV